jgi:hypothetical protein
MTWILDLLEGVARGHILHKVGGAEVVHPKEQVVLEHLLVSFGCS